ncbi:MAG: tetratricopeptide repeat protein [Abyssibacter sp.]|uniref:tetratricopeptide repeat protein n=1 Tax=Abyssibacter sp. TaxID=2320200 RepID=UPI002E9BE45E|nr:tetratricopeptide repeat protein [Pseudomonadota bacterium]
MKTLIKSTGLIAATMLLTSGLAHAASGLAPSQNPFATGTTQAPSDMRVAQRSQLGYGPQTFQSLGRRNMAEGDIESAERRFAEALEINPFDPVALNNLAAAKAEQGDYHTALELLERAERLAPESPDIAANLARLRGWVNYYAGNELHPAARIAVPQARMTEGLPPPPPALWEPARSQPRIVLPPGERYEGRVP